MTRTLATALQVEESYIGVDEFCKHVRQEPKAVLRNEVNVLQGLNFDLVVHNPHRPIEGLFQVGT